jgi:hypothetical protein
MFHSNYAFMEHTYRGIRFCRRGVEDCPGAPAFLNNMDAILEAEATRSSVHQVYDSNEALDFDNYQGQFSNFPNVPEFWQHMKRGYCPKCAAAEANQHSPGINGPPHGVPPPREGATNAGPNAATYAAVNGATNGATNGAANGEINGVNGAH